jgi:outer membrane protein
LKSYQHIILVVCSLMWMTTTRAFAQENGQTKPSGKVWSLKECIEHAQKNNIRVQQSDLQVRVNESNYVQSKMNRYADLNAAASQNIAWGRSVDPFTNSFVNQKVNSNNFSLNASVNLFNGYKITNTIKQNEINIQTARLDAEQMRYDVSLDIALAYLQILQNKELLQVAIQNVDATQKQLDRTQILVDGGALPEKDAFDLKATLANNELDVVTAQNRIITSKVQLQQVMNREVSDDFDVDSVSLSSLEPKDFAELPKAIYGEALQNQPGVKSADLKVESSEYTIQINNADRYPRLTLNGSLYSGYSSATSKYASNTQMQTQTIGYLNGDISQPVTTSVPVTDAYRINYPFFDQISDNFRQNVSLNLVIPIFNKNQVKTSVQNAMLTKKSSELEAQNTRNQLRQSIEQAYVDAKTSLNTYNARLAQINALQLTYDISDKRYQAGASTILDYNLAKINLDKAKSDLVRAKYDYLFRKKVLDFYQGKNLNFGE